jgi:hypothetical protein
VLKLTDAEIAVAAGISAKDLINWRSRGFLPPRTGTTEDIAYAYVMRVLSELGLHLRDAGSPPRSLFRLCSSRKRQRARSRSGTVRILLDTLDTIRKEFARTLDALETRH